MIPRIKQNLYIKLKSNILEQDMYDVLSKDIVYKFSSLMVSGNETNWSYYSDYLQDSIDIEQSHNQGYYNIMIHNGYGTEDGKVQTLSTKELYHNFGIKLNWRTK